MELKKNHITGYFVTIFRYWTSKEIHQKPLRLKPQHVMDEIVNQKLTKNDCFITPSED